MKTPPQRDCFLAGRACHLNSSRRLLWCRRNTQRWQRRGFIPMKKTREGCRSFGRPTTRFLQREAAMRCIWKPMVRWSNRFPGPMIAPPHSPRGRGRCTVKNWSCNSRAARAKSTRSSAWIRTSCCSVLCEPFRSSTAPRQLREVSMATRKKSATVRRRRVTPPTPPKPPKTATPPEGDAPKIRTCGTMPVHERLLRTDPAYMSARIASENHAFGFAHNMMSGARTGVTVIPVVVHVVFHTAAQNISDAQIHSQITILNQDYRKTNSDVSKTPSVFAALCGDARIEFQLASTDPSGNPTTGITRTSTSSASFSDDDKVKSSTTGGANAWPAANYLNIWVCQLGGGLLGYAQFPGGPAADR